MTTPGYPQESSFGTPDPHDLWDYLVGKGLSKKDATRHVLLTIQNSPEATRREFLKDVDPGKLAALGLGAADMMSFGLGKQIAAGLDAAAPESDRSYSALTESAAQAQHPTAHFAGEIAGAIGPAAAEYGLAKAGVLVPTAISRIVAGIANKPARLAAKTALNAVTGAGFAAAQAAGRAPAGQRVGAAEQAAPVGAVAGAALPFAVGSLLSGKRLLGRLTGPIADFVAGEGPAAAAAPRVLSGPAHTAGGVLEDIAQAVADRKAGRISEQDLNTAMEFAGRGMRGPPARVPDPGDIPTFMRRPPPALAIENGGLLAPSPAAEPLVAGGKPGHSYWQGGGSPTTSAEVRGGDPLLPSANPAVAKMLEGTSYQQLQAALRKPETPAVVKNLILIEIQRRGIAGPGLLAPR